ncbi:MAG TPA: DUF2293 domain-containing protein [Blastocatellia bacterium]|nr:DUF2293 domain-containing protein [Blastocatellia bacterium]
MSESQKKAKTDEIVVFKILRDSACAECGEELGKGRCLRLENERPLCLNCADLGHLVFLPRGDAALTRRASRYSSLKAVIVRFSRTRKRYERQGLLVEEAALARAEEECLADAEARERARVRRAERDAIVDERYRSEFACHIRELYPGCPESESIDIAEHACQKYSGRVGRSAEAKRFDEEMIALAVRAHVRHEHTKYDSLLNAGWSRQEARARVSLRVEQVLKDWSLESAIEEPRHQDTKPRSH